MAWELIMHAFFDSEKKIKDIKSDAYRKGWNTIYLVKVEYTLLRNVRLETSL